MEIHSLDEKIQYCLAECSEFAPNGYDLADVISEIKSTIDGETESWKETTDRFNKAYKNTWDKKKDSDTCQVVLENLSHFHRIESLASFSEEQQEIMVWEKYLEPFIRCAESLLNQVMAKRVPYIPGASESYLNAFYELSRKAVFSPDNVNLYNGAFRKSDFLHDLLFFAAKQLEKRLDNDPDYFQFSLFDPFAYHTLIRSLQIGAMVVEDTKAENNASNRVLNGLCRDLFLNSVQSAFHRFVSLRGTTYRIELNRHNSTLFACPYDALSSIEEIKPLRLFEKIATYIRNQMDHPSEIMTVSVCVIGHTEPSASHHERGLMDLSCAILNWFRRMLECEKITGRYLDMQIKNIVNASDGFANVYCSKRNGFLCKESGHQIHCIIEAVDYSSFFSFSTKYLFEQIESNDVIFLLDCPWLTAENYEIKHRGSLEAFCLDLSRTERDEPKLLKHTDRSVIKNTNDFYKQSIMSILDSQYNRVMASTTTQAGEIIRIPRDSMLRRIQKQVSAFEGGNSKKELYVFCSERDGLAYSYISSYPLTRKEQYDGKSHTIIEFRNTAASMLAYTEEDEIWFSVSLWSVLKYISVSYAYTDFKDEIDQIIQDVLGSDFEGHLKNPVDYFELYRSIVVVFKVGNALRDIEFSIAFVNGVDSCLPCDSPALRENMKKRLRKLCREFVELMYVDVVFSDKVRYGADAIKQAFSMNLYSCVENVSAMLFWHQFRMACMKEAFSEFHVSYNEKLESEATAVVLDKGMEFVGKDYFMDKKVYDALLLTLEQTTQITVGMNTMISDAANIFDTKANVLRNALNNILMACRKAEKQNTKLYYNALEMLKEA